MLPLPDNTPHSTVGIIGVPVIPWDNMYMAVHDTLSGDPAGIKTDIVAVRCILLINDLSGSIRTLKRVCFSSGVVSKQFCIWRKGITSICPFEAGNLSQRAYQYSFLVFMTVKSGEQNGQGVVSPIGSLFVSPGT